VSCRAIVARSTKANGKAMKSTGRENTRGPTAIDIEGTIAVGGAKDSERCTIITENYMKEVG
jgi:hypothetical protein